LVKALKNPSENYLLLIEEINRANVSAVFGDIFQLLDRAGDGESEYVIATSDELQNYLIQEFQNVELGQDIQEKLGIDFKRLYLPKNLYIWATMNSADQGVMPMDTAFRRRWEFTYLGIDETADINKEDFSKYKFKVNQEEVVLWDTFRREVNKKLSALNIPDFRAAEKTFQLLTQVAGRAGRVSGNGKVLIQTYNPQNSIFQLIKENNPEKIYQYFLNERKKYLYPPFVKVIFIEMKHRKEDKIQRASSFLGSILRKYLPEECVLGPEQAIISKINNLYYYQILLKLPRNKKYQEFKNFLVQSLKEFNEISAYKSIEIKICVDY